MLAVEVDQPIAKREDCAVGHRTVITVCGDRDQEGEKSVLRLATDRRTSVLGLEQRHPLAKDTEVGNVRLQL
jgi:hypothetical protein